VPEDATTQVLTPEQQRIAQLEGHVATLTGKLQDAEAVIVRLRRAYTHTLEQLQLLRHRIYVAKAERLPHDDQQLEFEAMLAQAQQLRTALEEAEGAPAAQGDDHPEDVPTPPPPGDSKPAGKPRGRRNLEESSLPEIRVEIDDPELEKTRERIGFEISYRLDYARGGMRRVVVARVVYGAEKRAAGTPAAEVPDTEAPATEASTAEAPATGMPDAAIPKPASFIRTPLPKELFTRSLLTPSMVAHFLTAKYMMGVPFYRLEEKFKLEGASLDRATMCRYAEDVGATLGAIVEAARRAAFASAFCLSTDATGVSIQPGPLDDRGHRPCRKAHFFVVLADRDHIFFEYQPKHTSAVACEMFKGFTGYIQADAHAIYDALFAGRPPRGQPPDPEQGLPPIEVGCWSHARRKFWDAAVCKHRLGLEGLVRIDAIFAADAKLVDLPPSRRKARRQTEVRPLVDAFFAWARGEHARERERGLVATALGYVVNQEQPLRRFLEDGRLKMDNNRSERALRSIATGRNAWLFFGSDDHASAAANLFSLIASCKLHGIDPESYLADVIRVMPCWPRERYLELAPKYWASTRARLDPTELARPIGDITVPPPVPAEQQPASD
jgi:hypothetical protein